MGFGMVCKGMDLKDRDGSCMVGWSFWLYDGGHVLRGQSRDRSLVAVDCGQFTNTHTHGDTCAPAHLHINASQHITHSCTLILVRFCSVRLVVCYTEIQEKVADNLYTYSFWVCVLITVMYFMLLLFRCIICQGCMFLVTICVFKLRWWYKNGRKEF